MSMSKRDHKLQRVRSRQAAHAMFEAQGLDNNGQRHPSPEAIVAFWDWYHNPNRTGEAPSIYGEQDV